MKHLNYQTEKFTLHVEVQDELTQADKDIITVLFQSLIESKEEVKPVKYGKTGISDEAIKEQVLRTLIDKEKAVSCKNGDCRIPTSVDEIPPNLLKKSSDTYKRARAKLNYLLKKTV